MNTEFQKLLLKQKEENEYHIPLEKEFIYYRRIANGDTSILKEEMTGQTEGLGKLSDDSIRNTRYHLIILTAMITRFCIEAGLNSETAYTMSDLLIRKLDRARSEKELLQIRYQILSQFIRTMNLEKHKKYSLTVTKSMEYIENHLTQPLTNTQVASQVSCTPDYLSRLFKKETGYTLSDYILAQKCNTACYLLENGTSSCTEISTFLGFSSCSHFIARFRSLYKITPAQYRRRHVRNTINQFGSSM